MAAGYKGGYMYFVSTRDESGSKFTASEAIMKGLAPDGGLFVPERIPALGPDFTMEKGYAYAAYEVIKPYFEGDEALDDLVFLESLVHTIP